MSSSPTNKNNESIRGAVDTAADTARDAIDKTSSWIGDQSRDHGLTRRLDRLSETAKDAVEVAASTVKQTADAAYRTKDHAAGLVRDAYQRSHGIGSSVIRQAQEQPRTTILVALAGVLIGFLLSTMTKSRG
jgi:ElaB/YqjD/DUF883 family membrane-anchored ribosome-binding protein